MNKFAERATEQRVTGEQAAGSERDPSISESEQLNDDLPRPSLLLLVTSLFVMTALTTPISWALSHIDGNQVIPVIVMGIFFVPLVVLQSYASFRRSAECAAFMGALLLVGAVLAFAVSIIVAFACLAMDQQGRPTLLLFYAFTATAAMFTLSILNLRWSARLIRQKVHSSIIYRWSLMEIMAMFTGLSAAIASVAPLFRN